MSSVIDERVAVVDNKNNVIGYKSRSQLTNTDCWRTACIWIEDGKGNILLQQRAADSKVDPLKWTCAAVGTVAADDSYEVTAVRELAEEIGVTSIKLKAANTVFCQSSFGWRWNKGFIAICDFPIERFTIQKEEVARLKWFDKKTVLREIKGKDPKYGSTVETYPQLFNLDT